MPVHRTRVWEVLRDPDLIARMTPFISSITAEGEHWHWTMTGIKAAGQSFTFELTERMDFQEHARIDFRHDPPAGVKERAGVQGWYVLDEAGDDATHLETHLEITVNLPLPRLSSPAVTSAMKGVMGTMGDRFAKNMRRHLGVA